MTPSPQKIESPDTPGGFIDATLTVAGQTASFMTRSSHGQTSRYPTRARTIVIAARSASSPIGPTSPVLPQPSVTRPLLPLSAPGAFMPAISTCPASQIHSEDQDLFTVYDRRVVVD